MKSEELRKHWNDEYKKQRETAYNPVSAARLEQKNITDLMKLYDPYEIYYAMVTGIEEGAFSVAYFCENIETYIDRRDYSKFRYFINKHGTQEHKNMLMDLRIVGKDPFLSVEDQMESKRLVKELEEWIQEISR